jgi:hypothetical protein
MRRRNRQNVSAIVRALSNYTIRREHGTTVITINFGGLVITIKVPP